MTQAALVLFNDDDPAVSMLGVPWPEFRLRSAMRAGAKHIVVVVTGRITPDIVAAVDAAKAGGVSTSLARTAAEAADLFHPDEAVLLLSGAAIVDDDLLARLLNAGTPTLACVEAHEDPVWELIDAQARWTGLARIDGAQIRATAAMVGDWDLASTLLRQAVAKARRVMLDESEPLWRADRPGGCAAAARYLVDGAGDSSGGWATRLVIRPIVRAASILAADRLAIAGRFAPGFAIAPALAAVGLAIAKWPSLAALMMFIAFLADAFGRSAERATGQEPAAARWRWWGLNGAAGIALAAAVIPPDADRAPIVMAVMLVIMAILADRLFDERDDPAWVADVPGYAVIIGTASLFGGAGMFVGLSAALLHAVMTLGWLQNRLSRALTQVR